MFLLIPDGKDTASLGQASLLLHTADPLLEDGGDLGGRGLCIGGIGAFDGVGYGGGYSLLLWIRVVSSNFLRAADAHRARKAATAQKHLQHSLNSIG